MKISKYKHYQDCENSYDLEPCLSKVLTLVQELTNVHKYLSTLLFSEITEI